jgi:hypothetical protein
VDMDMVRFGFGTRSGRCPKWRNKQRCTAGIPIVSIEKLSGQALQHHGPVGDRWKVNAGLAETSQNHSRPAGPEKAERGPASATFDFSLFL